MTILTYLGLSFLIGLPMGIIIGKSIAFGMGDNDELY